MELCPQKYYSVFSSVEVNSILQEVIPTLFRLYHGNEISDQTVVQSNCYSSGEQNRANNAATTKEALHSYFRKVKTSFSVDVWVSLTRTDWIHLRIDISVQLKPSLITKKKKKLSKTVITEGATYRTQYTVDKLMFSMLGKY